MSYKLLDLFCGAGGCSVGYHQAGFGVVGVDISLQPEYPYPFVLGNALELIETIGKKFDVIHASPPCQHFTKYNNCRKNIKSRYEDLIEPIRKALISSGKFYIIENVVGAPLNNPATLCGSMFGLDVRRHRLFETNFLLITPNCNHSMWPPNRYPGGRSRERGHARVLCRNTIEVGRWNIPIAVQQKGMGIHWISNLRMLSESIPPAYTEYIGNQLINCLEAEKQKLTNKGSH